MLSIKSLKNKEDENGTSTAHAQQPYTQMSELEEASTHNSVATHAGKVFLCLVTLTFDLLTPK